MPTNPKRKNKRGKLSRLPPCLRRTTPTSPSTSSRWFANRKTPRTPPRRPRRRVTPRRAARPPRRTRTPSPGRPRPLSPARSPPRSRTSGRTRLTRTKPSRRATRRRRTSPPPRETAATTRWEKTRILRLLSRRPARRPPRCARSAECSRLASSASPTGARRTSPSSATSRGVATNAWRRWSSRNTKPNAAPSPRSPRR